MVRPIKKKQIQNLQEAIKETAWKQIAEFGAPALSLRAIARELKITAPAIYNYFPRRDDLVTALIVDAFNSLADSQRQVVANISASKLEARFTAQGIAYREWALEYEQRYQLIFGTPIPGYVAPEDVTTPAAAWALTPLIETIQALYEAGKLRVERLPKLMPALKSMLVAWKGFVDQSGVDVHIESLYLAYAVWSRVHGLVSLELSHHTPSFITDPGEIFRREIESLKNQFVGLGE
ncbi:MAG: TetR/AcrR family transcriptional regulator [Chloroflexi bacterium]|nr:TetR/AcrR family transcriptional regulator [Chloroflexota bacterium]